MSLNPVQIVGLRQKRCSLRFGVGLCTATGTPCYNTWGTCTVKPAFDDSGMIEWLFINNRPGAWFFGDFTDPDDVRTNCIPVVGLTVSTSKAEANVAGVLDGRSPFGVHATCSVSMRDFVWSDKAGDFYLSTRSNMPDRTFWAVWNARNALYGGMELIIYDGYEGEAFSAYRQRMYAVDTIDGPDGDGNVTITGISPLVQAEGKRSLFPAAMDVKLVSAIDASQTTVRVVTNDETNLSRDFGISDLPGVIIGSEIMLYTGYTLIEAGVYDLTVQRGALNSVAATAAAEARVQRIGYFQSAPTWQAGQYLLSDHTPVGLAKIDTVLWADEGDRYLSTLFSTTVITAPTPVFDLMGEVCQQGMFFVWWDEYAQKVKMQAIRPPRGTVITLTGDANLVAGQTRVTREPQSTLTRVFVYHSPKDYTKNERANYQVVDGTVEVDGEDSRSGGESRTLEILARWVNTSAHAQQIISRVLSRYREVPRFLTVQVTSKDKAITIGNVCDVTQRDIVDAEGRVKSSRWQVISWEEVKPGEIYVLDLQTYDLIGRFAQIMANDAPDYLDATEDQTNFGCFLSDAAGLMSNGDPGYKLQ